MNEYLQDSNGDKSSKRLFGATLLGIGVVMCIVLFWFSISKPIGDPTTAKDIIQMLLMAGAGLLGIGVVEWFGKKKDDE